jgi:hypothetical protein
VIIDSEEEEEPSRKIYVFGRMVSDMTKKKLFPSFPGGH